MNKYIYIYIYLFIFRRSYKNIMLTSLYSNPNTGNIVLVSNDECKFYVSRVKLIRTFLSFAHLENVPYHHKILVDANEAEIEAWLRTFHESVGVDPYYDTTIEEDMRNPFLRDHLSDILVLNHRYSIMYDDEYWDGVMKLQLTPSLVNVVFNLGCMGIKKYVLQQCSYDVLSDDPRDAIPRCELYNWMQGVYDDVEIYSV